MDQSKTQKFANIINDESRVAMINLLMSNQFYTVTELAKVAKIKTHTASYHLKKMMELDLVIMEKHGRFHYYQLSNQEFAEFFEGIGAVAPTPKVRYLSQQIESQKLTQARTCYDHLAGNLGVVITEFLLEKEYVVRLEKGLLVTEAGEDFLEKNNINVSELKNKKRNFCGLCLDWSERKHHISGSVGNAIYELFLRNQWIIKSEKSRAVILTDKGKEEIKKDWGISFDSIKNYC